MSNAAPPLLLGSITDAGPDARGRVAVCGSHGGLYPAALASAAGLRAVILHDAGVGLDDAGVAGLHALDRVGMAAAAVAASSARIGDAADMAARGVLSTVNAAAASLGLAPGMAAAEAARRLAAATPPAGALPAPEEARREVACGAGIVVLVDSASLVGPGDAGRIVVAGSHGGLIGGDPARALKAPARLAAFHDAGAGAAGDPGSPAAAGLARLDALEARGVAAVAVDARTARIGDAASLLATGVLSAVNAPARALGLAPGDALGPALARLLDPAAKEPEPCPRPTGSPPST